MLRDALIQMLKNSKHIPYDEKLGDTSNPDYIGPKGVEELADDIIWVVMDEVTDVTHPSEYPEICAYCSRPAMEKYG